MSSDRTSGFGTHGTLSLSELGLRANLSGLEFPSSIVLNAMCRGVSWLPTHVSSKPRTSAEWGSAETAGMNTGSNLRLQLGPFRDPLLQYTFPSSKQKSSPERRLPLRERESIETDIIKNSWLPLSTSQIYCYLCGKNSR